MAESELRAVLACMDARIDESVFAGAAHVIRNAGGVVTDDAIRSLAISQNLLGTREIVLVHHTDCGMLKFEDEELLDRLERESGERPDWSPRAMGDLDESVRDSVERIRSSPFIPHKDSIRGYVFELESGRLREVQ